MLLELFNILVQKLLTVFLENVDIKLFQICLMPTGYCVLWKSPMEFNKIKISVVRYIYMHRIIAVYIKLS